MQVTDQSKVEKMRFELSTEFEFPFEKLAQDDKLSVVKCWKTGKYFWLRVMHPQEEQSYDFRILKIFRFLEATHLVVSPARRWNRLRSLKIGSLLQVLNPGLVKVANSAELHELQNQLTAEESCQIIQGNAAYDQLFEDQLMRTFASVHDWESSDDMKALAFEHRCIINDALSNDNQELEIDLTATQQDPGFISFKSKGRKLVFQKMAFLEISGKAYLGLAYTADNLSDVDKPPVLMMGLISKEKARILPADECSMLAPKYMDAIEEMK
ncbi:MAG: hypothetical protein K2X27_11630 [Candidatus Obscuribacterales bacterium]|nr:hypothetical protein [Candidatus Obscuribacterales bacterium]